MRFIAPLRVQAREHAEPKQPQCVCGESIGKMSDTSQRNANLHSLTNLGLLPAGGREKNAAFSCGNAGM